MPDLMAAMLDEKIAHPRAGANTAWVLASRSDPPCPLHYRKVNVFAVQARLAKGGGGRMWTGSWTFRWRATGSGTGRRSCGRSRTTRRILGYVVRWIDQGVGCSKVPDLNDVGLMEDRATCRISAQHIANWLHHGVVSPEEVSEAMKKKMAAVVDRQNAGDPLYRPMAPAFEGLRSRRLRTWSSRGGSSHPDTPSPCSMPGGAAGEGRWCPVDILRLSFFVRYLVADVGES